MRIVCPSCASEYEVPVERVGADGRQVRCAACREIWFFTPEPEPDPEPEASTAEPPTADERGPAEPIASLPAVLAPSIEGPVIDQPTPYQAPLNPPARARSRTGRSGRRGGRTGALAPKLRRAASALAAGVAVFVLGPLALLCRDEVVRFVPQTAAVYARLGLPVNLRGVDIRDVAAFQTPAQADKPAELVVEGDLVGVSRARTELADLAVEVRDERDQMLYHWIVAAPRAALEPSETARFRASLSAPPAAGRSVSLRFATARPENAPQRE